MDIAIIIDAGTLSLKASVYSQKGDVLYISTEMYSPVYGRGGVVQQNPRTWSQALVKAVRSCTHFAREAKLKTALLGLTAQRSSLIPVRQDGSALCDAIMWQDLRAQRVCDEMCAHEQSIYEHTGLSLKPIYGAPKMRWLQQEQPALYQRAFKLTAVPDYLLYQLTGQFVTDETYAARAMLRELWKPGWSSDLLAIFGVERDKLSHVVPPGTVCGGLRQEFARWTGLLQGTPVITCGGDQQCSLLGLTGLRKNTLGITIGTGGFVAILSDQPCLEHQQQHAQCGPSCIEGFFQSERSLNSAGSTYHWIHRMLFPTEKRDYFSAINSCAAHAPAGSNGVQFFLPGTKAGGWKGIHTGTGRDELARSVLEGIAIELACVVDEWERENGKVEGCILGGGMSRSDLFAEILCATLDRSIERFRGEDSTSLGAWAVAATASGWYSGADLALNSSQHSICAMQPEKETAAVYHALREAYMLEQY